jgi:hypothetical protein
MTSTRHCFNTISNLVIGIGHLKGLHGPDLRDMQASMTDYLSQISRSCFSEPETVKTLNIILTLLRQPLLDVPDEVPEPTRTMSIEGETSGEEGVISGTLHVNCGTISGVPLYVPENCSRIPAEESDDEDNDSNCPTEIIDEDGLFNESTEDEPISPASRYAMIRMILDCYDTNNLSGFTKAGLYAMIDSALNTEYKRVTRG